MVNPFLLSKPPPAEKLMIKELSLSTIYLFGFIQRRGDHAWQMETRVTALLKYCHSCMHKLISCDYTASAEIDGDKFGITMLGTMSPVCIALHIS